ncbi:MAG: acetate--CoA ligase family protein [Pseudomonadota bacterium]
MQIETIQGYVFGLRQPALILHWASSDLADPPDLGNRLWTVLDFKRPLSPQYEAVLANFSRPDSQSASVASIVAACLFRFFDNAPVPLTDPPVIREDKSAQTVECIIPVHALSSSKALARWIGQLLERFRLEPDATTLTGPERAHLVMLLHKLKQTLQVADNNIRLMRAAYTLGIPVRPLTGGVHLYGWGARGRRFQSTVSDATSALARQICGDKLATKDVLRAAGLPVPPGRAIAHPEDAARAAQAIGFPVVVKPADRDRGEGVAAGLEHVGAVLKAVKTAQALSPNVLLEKHMSGETYRVHVYGGTIWSIVKRYPAGVTGDGLRDIAALVAAENMERAKLRTQVLQVQPIVIDAEAEEKLAAQGLSLSSQPDAGQFVPLKASANVSTGGRTEAYKGPVHPETRAMLCRVAEVLQIDLTALDFITEDITQPWYAMPSAIIEANVGPQLSTLFTEQDQTLLESYVEGQGRLPAVCVLTPTPEAANKMAEDLRAQVGKTVGIAAPDGAFLGGMRLSELGCGTQAALSSLMLTQTCQGICCVMDLADLEIHGLPLDRVDLLAVTGIDAAPPMLAPRLLPHVRGSVIWHGLSKPSDTWAETNAMPDLAQVLAKISRILNQS